jgi:hypothetical protein
MTPTPGLSLAETEPGSSRIWLASMTLSSQLFSLLFGVYSSFSKPVHSPQQTDVNRYSHVTSEFEKLKDQMVKVATPSS